MSEVNLRMERVERLLKELRYELERGWMDGELDEWLGYQFVLPVSKAIKGGVVFFDLRTRPLEHYCLPTDIDNMEPRLKLIKGKRT